MIKADDLKDYFERSRRWEQDALVSATRSKRLAWTVATVAAVVAGMSVTAVSVLVPLKSVEPFLVRVDNSTGIIDTVSTLSEEPATIDEAMSRYFLAKYVRARESYSSATVEADYQIVSMMSTPRIQQTYASWISGNNPDSPQTIYGRHGRIDVSIKGIQLISDRLASIRYLKTARYENNSSTTHWIATVAFEPLENARLTIQQRLVNPLAIAITEYRNDPEVAE